MMNFIEDDKLNREKYADFLIEIMTNSKKYKRIGDSDSMTLAIDSAWGTGKTTFLKMLKNKLENTNQYSIVEYNAWKCDFTKNPFESLIYSFTNSNLFKNINNEELNDTLNQNFMKTVGKLLETTGKFWLRKKLGIDTEIFETLYENLKTGTLGITEVITTTEDNTRKFNDFCDEYKEYYDNLQEFKKCLEKIAEKKPIIVLIDELDRCRPLFAIELLESVKHLFDAENVIFVFAMDMEQLSHSIKCIYGQDMNASGYLSRFFDYISKMPEPDRKIYIESLAKSKPLNRIKFQIFKRNYDIFENKDFINVFADFSNDFNLSLRDINTIYYNFILFEQINLKETECFYAYAFYLFLLILKYTDIENFNKIIVYNEILDEKVKSKLNKCLSKYLDNQVIHVLENNDVMKEISYDIDLNNGYNNYNGKVILKEGEKIRVKGFENVMNFDLNKSKSISFSKLLFANDMKKWDEIKDKKLCIYLQEQLEFFNFESEIIKK